MPLSDAISRLSTHNKNEGKTIDNLDVSIHAIEELTGFNSLSVEKICQHTSKDQSMQLLIDHINNGFPDELSVCNGVVLKGNNRIIIPESLRPQAINVLHNKAHLGLNKML